VIENRARAGVVGILVDRYALAYLVVGGFRNSDEQRLYSGVTRINNRWVNIDFKFETLWVSNNFEMFYLLPQNRVTIIKGLFS
jgi:hypothetical protein